MNTETSSRTRNRVAFLPLKRWQGWHKGGCRGPTCHGEITPPAGISAPDDGLAHALRTATVLGPRGGPDANQQDENVESTTVATSLHPQSIVPEALGSAAAYFIKTSANTDALQASQANTTWLLSGGHLKKCIEIPSSPVAANNSFHHSISVQQLDLVLGLQETRKMRVLLFRNVLILY